MSPAAVQGWAAKQRNERDTQPENFPCSARITEVCDTALRCCAGLGADSVCKRVRKRVRKHVCKRIPKRVRMAVGCAAMPAVRVLNIIAASTSPAAWKAAAKPLNRAAVTLADAHEPLLVQRRGRVQQRRGVGTPRAASAAVRLPHRNQAVGVRVAATASARACAQYETTALKRSCGYCAATLARQTPPVTVSA